MHHQWIAALALVLGPAILPAADSTPPQQPIYIYLVSHDTDHVNLQMTEDRLRHMIPMLERYRKSHPEFRISATLLFSGAVSQALADRNRETKIKDYISEHAREGLIEPGYDGGDEPTYKQRPTPDFTRASTPEERWMARGVAAERFFSEARDSLTGAPKLGAAGGLQAMQDIFGPAAFLDRFTDDLGGDSETVYHLSRYNTTGILMGVPDPKYRPRGIHGFSTSAEVVGKDFAPVPGDSSELSWEDGYLRLAQISSSDLRVVMGYEGPEALEAVLAKMNRDRVRIVQIELEDQRMYLQPAYVSSPLFPPLQYAYENPGSPALPPADFRPAAELNAAQAKEDAMLAWLENTYFPANPGCRFISNAEIRERADPAYGVDVATDDLLKGIPAFLKEADLGNYLPNFLKAGDRYLSLADAFLLMSNALAAQHRGGKLPASIRLTRVYGPVEMSREHGPVSGTVNVASIRAVCADSSATLNAAGNPRAAIPVNMLPAYVTVDGIRINAGQFLRLMAQALVAPSANPKLNVRMSYMFSSLALMFPKTRNPNEQGGLWTYKPAALKPAPVAR
jgi:hypothetical protein